MATYTIGTPAGGNYTWRGPLTNPNAFGSLVTVGPSGNLVGTSGVSITGFGINAAPHDGSGNNSIRGMIWNSAGTAIWSGGLTTATIDTAPPFGLMSFLVPTPIILNPGTYYIGFTKSDSVSINWDSTPGNYTTAYGNVDVGDLTNFSFGPADATGSPSPARRLCGQITYTSISPPSAPPPPTTPGAPGFTVVGINSAVTVSYTAPTSDLAITSYQYSTDGTNYLTAPASPFNIPATANVPITIYLRAVSAAGIGAAVSGTATPSGITGGTSIDINFGNPGKSLKVAGGGAGKLATAINVVNKTIFFDTYLSASARDAQPLPVKNVPIITNSTGAGWWLRIDCRSASLASGIMPALSWTSWTTVGETVGSSLLNPNQWYKHKVTIEQTGTNIYDLNWYINGALFANKTFNNDAYVNASASTSYIGWHGDAGGGVCGDGWMDNLFIFDGVIK